MSGAGGKMFRLFSEINHGEREIAAEPDMTGWKRGIHKTVRR